MPSPGVQSAALYPTAEGVENGTGGVGMGGESIQGRNPLICCLCNDYYINPCLLQCYHTFCLKCLRGREVDGRISCPVCGNLTTLKDNSGVPPPDNLMKQLVDIANAENPPCANCDKRDKSSMFFCSTCGQSLCNNCRENTHRAKMFSSHDIVHMSRCSQDLQKRCSIHGEVYIMFNNVQKTMLCVTCFRDAPNETRMHCIDIDAAYTQSTKKLERAVIALCDVQNSVREGLILFKTHLEELRHNADCEKHTVNTFCQGMQESVSKTHSNMIMEIQRQYETKERSFRGQIVNLGIILPVIQMHLHLCQSFTNIANKFQFLDLANPMFERLSAITQLTQPQRPVQSSQIRTNYRNEFAQCLEPWLCKTSQMVSRLTQPQEISNVVEQVNSLPTLASTSSCTQPSKRQQSVLRNKALEGEGPFSNHCRSFDSQIKELSQQLSLLKERLNDLHRDVSLLRRAQTPPLISRYQRINGDCTVLEEQLERHQMELERMKNVFDTLWDEQLCRIHVEQDIFQSQANEILSLRAEVKHLVNIAQQLEPCIKSLTNVQLSQGASTKTQEQKTQSSGQIPEIALHSQQLQTLLDHINSLQLESSKLHSSAAAKGSAYSKEGKERIRPRTPSHSPGSLLDSTRNVVYDSHKTQQPIGEGSDKRGSVLSQLIDKVRIKDDKKKIVDDRERIQPAREKSKLGESSRVKGGFDDSVGAKQSASGIKAKVKKETRGKDGKVALVYQSIAGSILKTKSEPYGIEMDHLIEESRLPPPPPPVRKTLIQDQGADIREKLETHLKEKLQEMGSRSSSVQHHAIRASKARSLDADIIEDYHRMSEGLTCGPDDIKTTRVLIHREPYNKIESTSTSPLRQDRRSAERSGERERSRERRDKRDRSREGRDKSKESRDKSREDRGRSREGSNSRERSWERIGRRDKFGRYYPASDTEESIFYQANVTKKQNSFDSLTLSPVSVDSRKSSGDLGERKTLVLVIGNRKGSKQRLHQKQRSWETFPPKKKNYDSDYCGGRFYRYSSGYADRASSFQSGRHSLERASRKYDKTHEPVGGSLKKADSFEGHEEAVRTLVAAVHQTRSQQLQMSRRSKTSAGHVSN